MKVRYTRRALLDLAEIHDFISGDNPAAARRVLAAIRRDVRLLQDSPHLGRQGRIEDTRELVVGRLPFIVAYRLFQQEIQILSVIHTARSWPEVF